MEISIVDIYFPSYEKAVCECSPICKIFLKNSYSVITNHWKSHEKILEMCLIPKKILK